MVYIQIGMIFHVIMNMIICIRIIIQTQTEIELFSIISLPQLPDNSIIQLMSDSQVRNDTSQSCRYEHTVLW